MDANPYFLHLLDPRFFQPNQPVELHPASVHGRIHPTIPRTDPETRQPADPGHELPGRIQPVLVGEFK